MRWGPIRVTAHMDVLGALAMKVTVDLIIITCVIHINDNSLLCILKLVS